MSDSLLHFLLVIWLFIIGLFFLCFEYLIKTLMPNSQFPLRVLAPRVDAILRLLFE
jgi:hypothetical protein